MNRITFALFTFGLLLATIGCEATPRIAAKDPEVSEDVAGVDPELLKLARTDHVALLKRCIEHYEALPITNYTCTFLKHERLNGKLRDEQLMDVKFMAKPFSVAITWTQNPPLADKVLYIEGKWPNDDGKSRMLVRPRGGFTRMLTGGSLLKLPDGPDAMKNTLRPVTLFGFRNTLQALLDVYEVAQKRGDLQQRFNGISEVGGRKCLTLVRILPERDDYPARKTVTCIDIERMLPLKVLGDGWQTNDAGKHILLANYEYRDVTLNPGLTQADFAPEANDIASPR
ncbi:MAG: DUF1571 domain-containing protein [Planctomycetes bacterium]|jgi:hypothetical protein|nr:DUF1571 domain-containing protein [Planctomycetota bacterium]